MRARRRFAQHFLEPAWVRKLADRLVLDPDDAVLEIGAGRGALTLALAAAARAVVAIEIDRDLARVLRARAPANLSVIEGDVLRLDLPGILADLAAAAGPAGRVRAVGNLPYNISSPILFRLVAAVRSGSAVHDATIMLQREVADRVAARPGTGDWGPLGIAVQMRAEVTRVLALPPGAFRPAPQVQSAVIRLEFRPPPVVVQDEAVFDSLVRALFGQRRKMLLNALRPFASTRGLDPRAVLDGAGLDGQRRPQTLDLAELARLAAHVATPIPGGGTAML